MDVDKIKELRMMTSCGVIDCKKALKEAGGNIEKAKEILRQRGLEIAAKKADRKASQGRIESYIHLGNKIGVLLEVNCETDFVARNDDFIKFAKDVAMQIAASRPSYVRSDDVPEDVLEQQDDKDGFYKQQCLLHQVFIRDSSITIQDYLNSLVAKIGENIVVRRFVRFQVGEE